MEIPASGLEETGHDAIGPPCSVIKCRPCGVVPSQGAFAARCRSHKKRKSALLKRIAMQSAKQRLRQIAALPPIIAACIDQALCKKSAPPGVDFFKDPRVYSR
jgi:hypothetical protein